MELQIIEDGVRIDGVRQEIGTIVTIQGDTIPSSLIGKVADRGERVFVTNPAPEKTNDAPALKGPFTIGEATSGWYPVLDGDGKKVKNLRKDDAEAFATLSDDDKFAYLSE